ncbi:3-hydroxybutyryl-CoA dehydrogenase [Burkholderia pseudomultivorans]|uniref:L-gulonate 3-dehydrogenase n=2 Tax=Burkholderia cepacia complex TaxID=87882 RepID=A0AAN0RZY0_9BURK|nr:3-hydroxybutyryl-CoA dehydrogenase [Burkholderia pseudomultivorans]AIO36883.1 3-hydroxyacyl-CoA dehydrogenase, NAD binding domain protein [Burkholderia cenocepacia]KWF59830.1 3-hydroxybutyryl-CoA dehydrogenase [Burkholderia pseudomultivorans]
MTPAADVTRVHVLGAGRMGQGIALVFAFAGLDVTLIDFKPRDAAGARAFDARTRDEIGRPLHAQVALGRIDAAQADAVAARIALVARDGAAAALHDAAIVFEALPERLDAKADALRWLGAHVDARTTIASTTSTFVVTELQRHVTHPRRMLNAHWLNPALLMPLVEISRSDATDPQVVDALAALLERVGKRPVICGPAPGYIVPRIQALAMNEAARMVEEGVASAADIDTAIRTGFGPRFAVLGLLEFIDWGGCDILYYASKYLAGEIGPRFAPADSVVRNMAAGRDGVRTGAGFHDYAEVDVPAYMRQRLGEFARLLDHLGLAPEFDAARRGPAGV